MLLIVDFGLPIADCASDWSAAVPGRSNGEITGANVMFCALVNSVVAAPAPSGGASGRTPAKADGGCKMGAKWCRTVQIVRLCPHLSPFVALCPLKQGPAPLCGHGGGRFLSRMKLSERHESRWRDLVTSGRFRPLSLACARLVVVGRTAGCSLLTNWACRERPIIKQPKIP
jgi:hypothetical protein